MGEFGDTRGVASAGPVISATHSQISGTKKMAVSRMGANANDDRAAAMITNPLRSDQPQFPIGQLPDAEQIIRETQRSLGLVKFSFVKLQEEFIEALRSQANVEPDRALHLLN